MIAVRLQEGLAAAGAVVFVVSPESAGRGWVNEEFAAAAAGRQRLIPVLYGEVGLSPLVACSRRRMVSPGSVSVRLFLRCELRPYGHTDPVWSRC